MFCCPCISSHRVSGSAAFTTCRQGKIRVAFSLLFVDCWRNLSFQRCWHTHLARIAQRQRNNYCEITWLDHGASGNRLYVLQNRDTHSIHSDVGRHHTFDQISLEMGLHPTDAIEREVEANVPGSEGEIQAEGLRIILSFKCVTNTSVHWLRHALHVLQVKFNLKLILLYFWIVYMRNWIIIIKRLSILGKQFRKEKKVLEWRGRYLARLGNKMLGFNHIPSST